MKKGNDKKRAVQSWMDGWVVVVDDEAGDGLGTLASEVQDGSRQTEETSDQFHGGGDASRTFIRSRPRGLGSGDGSFIQPGEASWNRPLAKCLLTARRSMDGGSTRKTAGASR